MEAELQDRSRRAGDRRTRRGGRSEVELRIDGGRVVCPRCTVARRPVARMRGLLGRSSLPTGEGLLIESTGSIHTFFMQFPIDAVFLDSDWRVRKVVSDLKPGRTAGAKGARAVLELAAGEAERVGVKPGDRLAVAP
jgi:uncharacterized membrane protein (UPF0127 family)